jgi:hypothetical protein
MRKFVAFGVMVLASAIFALSGAVNSADAG